MQKEIDIFENYINNYDLNIPELYKKKMHTYRVVEFAKEIASSINLSEDDTNKACICALFHDLGRFPQFSKYKTFQDAISIDHGDKSYEILKELNYNDQDVLSAVKYHNKYSVPQDLSDSEILFANITRDADKLDILYSEPCINNDDDYDIPNEVFKALFDKKLVPNNLNVNDSDSLNALICMGFTFDFNFKYSYELLYKTKIMHKKLKSVYNNFFDTRLIMLNAIINKYIEERVDSNARKKIRS